MASYYDLLGVAPTASADEIKIAFRREIAKYHPDKVQHLGHEFQDIAAVKAADLTQAYKTLTDDSRRAEYDADLAAGGAAPAGSRVSHAPPAHSARPSDPPRPAPSRSPSRDPDPPPDGGTRFSTDRAGAGDLVRKAALARFRQAVDAEFGRCDETPVQGFEIACAPPKGRFWSKTPPRVLARFVPQVDAAAVSESWALASRRKWDDQRELCVFVMGAAVAPAGELARAIAEERRRPGAAPLVLVPINTRSWAAHIPNDAPPIVKALVTKLKTA